jgi:hypothetical protein
MATKLPEERARDWEDAYTLLNKALGVDYARISKENLERLNEEITQTTGAKGLEPFEEQITNDIETGDLVLARGSRNWGAIEEYGWMLSDLGLEEEKIVKTSSTQRVDREAWGNHDFVFFFYGYRSHVGNPALSKKYGAMKFFDPQVLHEKGWISLGDWMEFYNAQPIALPTTSVIGELSIAFQRSKSTDRIRRAQETRKGYRFGGQEKSMRPRLAVHELFFGPDIKKALASHLILFLRCFAPRPLLLKRLGDHPVPTLLNTYLPMIEAKIPRAMSMKHVIGNGTGAAISPATAMSTMISAGSGTG